MGSISGIGISTLVTLAHFLFVDDVVLFGKGTVEEWCGFRTVIDAFTPASGMFVSTVSHILKHLVDDGAIAGISTIFPYSMEQIEGGFKYLRFWVKPLNYLVSDWHWLVRKFEKRVCNWSYRSLSPRGDLYS